MSIVNKSPLPSSVAASVTVMPTISLDQPWSGDCTADQIRKAAIEEATAKLYNALNHAMPRQLGKIEPISVNIRFIDKQVG